MVQPKKHLGQHFLVDDNIARKIVNSISVGTNNLIEIGPGTGVLTKFLIDKDFSNFKVIEIDRESVAHLNRIYPDFSSNIISADFLKIDLNEIFNDQFSVIGNFPYNISTQILFKVLENRNQVIEVVGMFQKEVAERIASKSGNKKYGILSVLVQAFFDIEYLFTVSENVFFPPPKVKSAVIRLKRNDMQSLGCEEDVFFRIVKAAFNQRRKTLRNALHAFQFNLEASKYLSLRAEQLDVKDFMFLCNNLA